MFKKKKVGSKENIFERKFASFTGYVISLMRSIDVATIERDDGSKNFEISRTGVNTSSPVVPSE